MAEIYMEPEKYQEQVDKFKEGSDAIASSKCEINNKDQVLKSVEKYIECIKEFNDLIDTFQGLSELDANSMQLIKAKWMHADSEVATKTFGEILFGK